jgi:hypothetical protein
LIHTIQEGLLNVKSGMRHWRPHLSQYQLFLQVLLSVFWKRGFRRPRPGWLTVTWHDK